MGVVEREFAAAYGRAAIAVDRHAVEERLADSVWWQHERDRLVTSPARARVRAAARPLIQPRAGCSRSASASRPGSRCGRPAGPTYRRLQALMRGQGLHTVCEEANCPNIGECWERGTATFMILGDVCTRRCGFCNVKSGVPGLVDRAEPLRVAHAVAQMGLRHCVVTSVDRDDLPTAAPGVFADTIRAIRARAPGCAVEVLTPDFRGQEMPLARVIDARPDVFNHNVETVPRLYPKARRGSDFLRSCRVLLNARRMDPRWSRSRA